MTRRSALCSPISHHFVLATAVLISSVAFPAQASASSKPKSKMAPKKVPRELVQQVVANYSDVAFQSYSDAVDAAKALQKTVFEFVAEPSTETHDAAKDAWKVARDTYSPTEVFRFYGGPIDDPKDGPEGILNAWPIDESYIDYVKGSPLGGIVNHPMEFPEIFKHVLLSVNEKNGEKNISTGFHAVEFLLWGQDNSLIEPGTRSFQDYVEGTGAPNPLRRARYINALCEILIDKLTAVRDAWAPGSAYRKQLASEDPSESLRKIYTGIINLSIDEMAGERMTVALEKNDQENEQDCFSDYTLKDLESNERGIHRVYFGAYKNIKGPGLDAIVKAIDPALAKRTEDKLNKTLSGFSEFKAPFDAIIAMPEKAPQRKLARKTIVALQDQALLIAKSGTALGLILNVQ